MFLWRRIINSYQIMNYSSKLSTENTHMGTRYITSSN